jgi:hypothetical protein
MIYTEHEYLAHHGIDKQKWGHRNGPPYPLKPDQMTQKQKRANVNEGWFKRKVREDEKREDTPKKIFTLFKKKEKTDPNKVVDKKTTLDYEKKSRIYKEADVREALKYKNELSNKDIQDILDRYNIQQALSQKVSNLDRYKKMELQGKIEDASKYINSVVNLGKATVNMYNLAGSVAAYFGDKNFKPIKLPGSDKKDNNKNKNKNN